MFLISHLLLHAYFFFEINKSETASFDLGTVIMTFAPQS